MCGHQFEPQTAPLLAQLSANVHGWAVEDGLVRRSLPPNWEMQVDLQMLSLSLASAAVVIWELNLWIKDLFLPLSPPPSAILCFKYVKCVCMCRT